MKRSQLFLFVAVWTALLGLSMAWAASPVLRPPSTNINQITEAQVNQSFGIRLAPTQVESQYSTRSHFDYDNWAFRETKHRVLVLLVLWVTGTIAATVAWHKKKPVEAKA